MNESSINIFEFQKHQFLNAARKTLSDLNKNNTTEQIREQLQYD